MSFRVRLLLVTGCRYRVELGGDLSLRRDFVRGDFRCRFRVTALARLNIILISVDPNFLAESMVPGSKKNSTRKQDRIIFIIFGSSIPICSENAGSVRIVPLKLISK